MSRIEYRNGSPTQHAQGDFLIESVATDAIPTNLALQLPQNGELIVGYGEVTGHTHAIQARGVTLTIEKEGAQYMTIDELIAPEGATIVHQEHAPLTLKPGTYKITRQREVTDTDDGVSFVSD